MLACSLRGQCVPRACCVTLACMMMPPTISNLIMRLQERRFGQSSGTFAVQTVPLMRSPIKRIDGARALAGQPSSAMHIHPLAQNCHFCWTLWNCAPSSRVLSTAARAFRQPYQGHWLYRSYLYSTKSSQVLNTTARKPVRERALGSPDWSLRRLRQQRRQN
ncbi:hypothetical protein VTI74DRAFT_11420 [Chaetomium olivicolor]